MKKTTKITLSGMMAALAITVMFVSYFPYLTYAVPAISGLFIMVVVIEINRKWALLTYLASAVIIALWSEPESKLMYLALFGYYPILKSVLEGMRKPVFEWILKLVVFNTAVLAVYYLLAKPFGISMDDLQEFGKYGVGALLLLGNAVFVVYDIAVSRMAMVYMNTLHNRIKKLLR